MEFGKRQIGNLVILKYKKSVKSKKGNASIPFIKVSAASGGFSVEYMAGSGMFMLLDSCPLEDKEGNLPMLILRNTYYVGNMFDAQFQVDVLKAIGACIERADAEPLSEEEDAKIIEEERRIQEIKEEMGKEGGNE